MMPKRSVYAVVVSAALMTACGGGGGGGSASSGGGSPAPATTYTIGGVVATGASVPFAQVSLKDVTGATTTATANANGQFTLTLADMTGPYLIRAVSPNGTATLYAIAQDEDLDGSLSVTPLSTLVLANVFGKDPAAAFADFSTTTAVAVSTKGSAAFNLYTSLSPLFSALAISITDADMLLANFVADHTGLDRVLDAITISFSGNTATIADKMGNTLFADDISSNIDVPAAVITGDIGATTDKAVGIADYLTNLTQKCGNLASQDQCSTMEPATGFRHWATTSFTTFVRWYQGAGASPTVEYLSPTLKFIDGKGVWAEFPYIVSTTTGSTRYKDSGYFTDGEGSWRFIGDQSQFESPGIDITYDAANASILWKVRSRGGISPDWKNAAYVRLTSSAFNGEVRLYKNTDRWPDQFNNFVSQNCTAVSGTGTATTCDTGYVYDSVNYPLNTVVSVSAQFVDTEGDDIPGWRCNGSLSVSPYGWFGCAP